MVDQCHRTFCMLMWHLNAFSCVYIWSNTSHVMENTAATVWRRSPGCPGHGPGSRTFRRFRERSGGTRGARRVDAWRSYVPRWVKACANVYKMKRKRSAFVTKGLNTFTGMVGSGHGSRTRHEHNHAWRSIRFHAMPARAHGLPCRPHCGTVRDRRGTRSARMRRQSCA